MLACHVLNKNLSSIAICRFNSLRRSRKVRGGNLIKIEAFLNNEHQAKNHQNSAWFLNYIRKNRSPELFNLFPWYCKTSDHGTPYKQVKPSQNQLDFLSPSMLYEYCFKKLNGLLFSSESYLKFQSKCTQMQFKSINA